MAEKVGVLCQAAGLVFGFEELDIKVDPSYLTNGLMVEMFDYGRKRLKLAQGKIGRMILNVLPPSVHLLCHPDMLGRRVSEMRSEYIGYRGKIRIEFSKLPFRLFLVDETVTQTTPSDQASDVVVTNSLGDSSCTEVVPSDPASDVIIDTTAFHPQVPSFSASNVRAYSTCKTKLSKNADEKKANFCSFEIGKKQAHLEFLKKQVDKQKMKLLSMKSKEGHYNPRNLNKKEISLKCKNTLLKQQTSNLNKVKKENVKMSSDLSQTIEHLKLENAKLMKDNERLQSEIDLHIDKEQKKKKPF